MEVLLDAAAEGYDALAVSEIDPAVIADDSPVVAVEEAATPVLAPPLAAEQLSWMGHLPPEMMFRPPDDRNPEYPVRYQTDLSYQIPGFLRETMGATRLMQLVGLEFVLGTEFSGIDTANDENNSTFPV